jgi:ribonuclease P protein component
VRRAAGPRLATLKRRRDFLAAARARRASFETLTLQARARRADEPAEAPVRVGYTCSKKVGNAVTRNRAKRRLRAVAAELLSEGGRDGWDYVLIGKPEATGGRPFDRLREELAAALARVHAPRAERPRAPAAGPASPP